MGFWRELFDIHRSFRSATLYNTLMTTLSVHSLTNRLPLPQRPTRPSKLNHLLRPIIALPLPKMPILIATPIADEILTTSIFRVVTGVFPAVVYVLLVFFM